jgi:hypothetical protein
VTLVPEEHLLEGESSFSSPLPLGTLDLELSPEASISGVESGDRPLPYTFHGGRLTVATGGGDGPTAVTIRYRLTLNDPLPTARDGGENPGFGVRGIISPRGVFLGGDAGWYPRPETTPRWRTIRIDAPAGMEGVTAGERLSRETVGGRSRSLWREEPAVGDLALSAGPYVITERRQGGILLSTYLYPENAHLASSYLDASATYLRLFAELFGPYPFTKFAVVENFFPTGYGFPSFTLLGSTVIRLPFITTTSLPHEIAHSWWGNGVLVGPTGGNWCEGLVTYLADHLLEERKGGNAGRDYRLRMLSDFSLLVPPGGDFPLTRFASRVDPASRAIGYGKGAMVWHMLRTRVGDAPFFAALGEVYRSRRFRTATWDDFARALADASGQRLETFLPPWLEQPGGPLLSLADVVSRRQGEKWLVTGRVVQQKPYFPLLVPLRLEAAAAPFEQTLPLTAGEKSFHFLSDTPPRRLLLDPGADLFRLLPAGQLPANVNRLKGSTALLAVATPPCEVPLLRRLLQGLGRGETPVVTEDELGRDRGGGRDLIFCGIPRSGTGLFALPPGVDISPEGFRVGSERYRNPDDLLFVVTRSTSSPGRVAALLLPLSPGGGEGAVGKIGHYGNYDTLVFSSGVNRHKGRIPPEPAGAVVTFGSDGQP